MTDTQFYAVVGPVLGLASMAFIAFITITY